MAPSWKLYYYFPPATFDHGRGRVSFDSNNGPWEAAPAWGVMALAVAHPVVGRQIERRRPGTGDYYLWRPDAPAPWWVDSGGLEDYLIGAGVMTADQTLEQIPAEAKIAAGVKYGRSVDDATWAAVWEWVVADADATFGGLEGEGVSPSRLD